MNSSLVKMFSRYVKSLQWSTFSFSLLLSISFYLLLSTYFNHDSVLITIAFSIAYLSFSLWSIQSRKHVLIKDFIKYLHASHPELQFSLELGFREAQNEIEVIQKERIEQALQQIESQIKLPNSHWKIDLKQGFSVVAISVIFSIIPFSEIFLAQENSIKHADNKAKISNNIRFDSLLISSIPPKYTASKKQKWTQKSLTNQQNYTLIEDSEIEISLFVKGEPVSIIWYDAIENSILSKNKSLKKTIKNTSAIQFEATFQDTVIKSSILAFTVLKDNAPELIVKQPTFSRTEFQQPITIPVEVDVKDDFKLSVVQMKVTLARGTGENVRFRELTQKMSLNPSLPTAQTKASYIIDPVTWEMEPGDELYFYVEAVDNKPEPNRSRTDTYFVLWRDSSNQFTDITAKVAVNLVPDFFRSQRQIIIDTEKLLSNKSRLSLKEFNEESNEIAYNQQLLRLRYGQYLGLEDEGMSEGTSKSMDESGEIEEHHEEEIDPETGLAEAKSSATSALASDLIHKHEDPEMNTFIKEAPRNLLKKSLDNMWQSELHLRLYDPQTALPYEYNALKYLKDVQQSGRVYVRKAGTAVTPIEESTMRLKGKLAGIQANKRTAKLIDKEQQTIRALINNVRKSLQQKQISEALIVELKQSVQLLNSREKQVEWIQHIFQVEKRWNENDLRWIDSELENLLELPINSNPEHTISQTELDFLRWFNSKLGASK